MVTMTVVMVKFPTVSLVVTAVTGVVAVAIGPPVFKTTIWRLPVTHVVCDAGASSTAYARTDNGTRSSSYRLADGSSRGTPNGATDHRAILVASVACYSGSSSATQCATNHRTALATHALSQNRTCRCTCATPEQGCPVISVCQGRHQECTCNTSACNPTRVLNCGTKCG